MDHHERDLRHALQPIVQLRSSPFRNVLIARVDDPMVILTAVDELAGARPRLESWSGKALPITATFSIDPERFESQVEAAIAPLLGEVAARSFHLRIERRGHKGRIDSHSAERSVGTWVVETLAARGTPGQVDFHDPDLVIAIEVLGSAAGIALVSRGLRRAHRFVRID